MELCNVDGRLCAPADALVPVTDRGFLYGDSVYEVVRTYGGKPFELQRHLQRMRRTAERLAIQLPGNLERELQRTLEAAGNGESYARIVVTRGSGAFGLGAHLSHESRLVIIVRPLQLPTDEQYARGLCMAIARTRRNSPLSLDPALKTGNYLNNILALKEAHDAGADDAILLDLQGRVTEATTSNVFFARKNVVITPPLDLGMLEGVTRAVVLEAAKKENILVREEPFGPEALAAADEVFVTSTLREVMPVTSLVFIESPEQKRLVSEGKPGPIAQQLRRTFPRA